MTYQIEILGLDTELESTDTFYKIRDQLMYMRRKGIIKNNEIYIKLYNCDKKETRAGSIRI